MLRTDLVCTVQCIHKTTAKDSYTLSMRWNFHHGTQSKVITTSMNSISVGMSRKIFSRQQKQLFNKILIEKYGLQVSYLFKYLLRISSCCIEPVRTSLCYGHLLINWLNFWRVETAICLPRCCGGEGCSRITQQSPLRCLEIHTSRSHISLYSS